MDPDLAARLDAAVCPADPRHPVHLHRDLAELLLAQRRRVAETLTYLRQYLTDSPDLATVPARDVWNHLCERYFDPHRYDPDEMSTYK